MTGTRSRWLAATALALCVLVQSPVAAASGPVLVSSAAEGADVLGCVVRFTTAGPKIHANGAHICTLGTEVRVSKTGRLVLLGAPSRAVVTLECFPDESLVVRGIACGPSGGPGQIAYQLTKNGQPLSADSYRLVCSVCNLWLGGTYQGAV